MWRALTDPVLLAEGLLPVVDLKLEPGARPSRRPFNPAERQDNPRWAFMAETFGLRDPRDHKP